MNKAAAIKTVIVVTIVLGLMAIIQEATAQDTVVCRSISTGEIEIFYVACPVGYQEVG